MSDELKPCPFCGASAERYPNGDMEGYSVMCSGKHALFGATRDDCPMHTFGYVSQEEADAAWNHRAVADTPAVSTDATMRGRETADWQERNGNFHPTVKPSDLMAYLCRLVTPPGGLVLDPFMGGGSTIAAASAIGYSSIGIEKDPGYFQIAKTAIPALALLTPDGAATRGKPIRDEDSD